MEFPLESNYPWFLSHGWTHFCCLFYFLPLPIKNFPDSLTKKMPYSRLHLFDNLPLNKEGIFQQWFCCFPTFLLFEVALKHGLLCTSSTWCTRETLVMDNVLSVSSKINVHLVGYGIKYRIPYCPGPICSGICLIFCIGPLLSANLTISGLVSPSI